jgi:two-component system, cell cycle sensor histidine kinase and response regulator CckA
MKPYKIVVIDDEEEPRNLAKRILIEAGYQVITAPSGLEGLVSIQAEQPDIVVSDVVMPDIDGLEMCSLIKSDPLLKNTYVLLISGLKITSESQAAGLEAGADDYITKPYSQRELLARVKNLISLKTTRQALKAELEQQRLETVGRLATYIAHEFNNYLAIITLYTDLMLVDSRMLDTFQPRLNIIQEQSKNAANFVAQILDFSRRGMMRMELVNLAAFLGKSVAVIQEILPSNIHIHLDTGDMKLFLQADPNSLQKILFYLSLNAKDAMPDGGQLTFKLEGLTRHPPHMMDSEDMVAEQWVILVVKDTGIGIDSEIIDKIFDPFFSTKHPTEAKGLGLAQVHGIVSQHGGTITVDSEKNQGTTFTIYLPVEAELTKTAVTTIEDTVMTEIGTSKGHILLIDENANARSALAEVLECVGYQLTTAETAHEGLAICRQQHGAFDLVISDFWLPDRQSSKFFTTVSAEFPTIKHVLMTDQLVKEDDIPASIQVEGLIVKPFVLDQILSTIQALVNKTDD